LFILSPCQSGKTKQSRFYNSENNKSEDNTLAFFEVAKAFLNLIVVCFELKLFKIKKKAKQFFLTLFQTTLDYVSVIFVFFSSWQFGK